jgi:ATP-dependent DNA helicase RecQ
MSALRSELCSDEKCLYCSRRRDLRASLKSHFGFDEFRRFSPDEKIPAQETAVRWAVENRSFIAVFPTGGGKSITFQLPALMAGEASRGLTVVISPLVALMKDQIDNLLEKDITSAVTINGLLSPLERSQAFERVESGQATMLYIAPESLRSESMLRLLSKRTIARFVIDEAHCFSAWGHDFRVDYLFIGRFIKILREEQGLSGPIPVSCLTATAKPEVISDIKSYFRKTLELDLDDIAVDSARKNLDYSIFACRDDREKMEHLVEILNEPTGPVIVYCSRIATVEAVSMKLGERGVSSVVFHGDLNAEAKKSNMQRFMEGGVNTVVATNAFGMGVDKDDVSLVIHYDVPASLENYAQETGRAGRRADIEARCCLLFNEDDIKKHFQLFLSGRVNQKEIAQVWQGIKKLTKNSNTTRRSALEIAMLAGWDTEQYSLENKVRTAISVLEEQMFVERDFNHARVYAVSLLVRDVEISSTMIDASPLSADDKRLGKMIVQRVIKDNETRIDHLADRLDAAREDVVRLVEYLKTIKILNDKELDLSAYVNTLGNNSIHNSKMIFRRLGDTEKTMIEYLEESPEKISLRDLNSFMLEKLPGSSSVSDIRRILNYWEIQGYVVKKRIDPVAQVYRLNYRVPYDQLKDRAGKIRNISAEILEMLHERAVTERQNSGNSSVPEVLVGFSVPLLREFSKGLLSGILHKAENNDIYRALLYLNSTGAVRLDKGFFIYYSPMTVVRKEANPRRQFTAKDYELIEKFYSQKVEQIHIILKYARMMQENIDNARKFTSDYFTLSHDEFVNRYYRTSAERECLVKPIHADTFKQIYGSLSPEQLKILMDNRTKRILVAAGPGSGKTRVLVHKVASILATEDVKPEQFLMLTFSRSAAMEFRSRLQELVGDVARYIEIFTYHSFCFNLLGLSPSEEALENVIEKTIEELGGGNIDLSRLGNKSMLVIDEFQDTSKREYELVEKIMTVAGELRVLVVGDDDQNIFSFRGASNEYMKLFLTEESAKYELVTNFRSSAGIVDFSNRLRRLIKTRIKENDLVAHSAEPGLIRIYNCRSKNLVQPLVNAVRGFGSYSNTAILTERNEDVSIIHTGLREAGIPATMNSRDVNFRISDLAEIAFFTELLHKSLPADREIPRETWNRSLSLMREKYGRSKNLSTAEIVTESFAQVYSHIFFREWLSHIVEMKINDVHNDAGSGVLVSTIHKAKGREYDNVFLMIGGDEWKTDDRLRLLYVGVTRTKHRLSEVTNTGFFASLADDRTEIFQDNTIYQDPGNVSINLNYDDVYLDFYKNGTVSATVSSVHAGNPLAYMDKDQIFYLNKKHACMMSKKGKAGLRNWFEKG